MKIGVLTLPIGYNYGGILQAWALKTVLSRDNNQVYLLKERKQTSIKDDIREFFFRVYFKLVKRNKEVEIFRPIKETIIRNTRPFIKRNFKIIELNDNCKKKLDAIVVGSDQVWRNIYAGSSLNDYFLEFAKEWDVKKIAYAASFGVDYCEFTDSEIAFASKMLPLFDAVSVREHSGIALCKKMLGYKEAEHMPDPTLLLYKKDYLSLIVGVKKPKYFTSLFRYVLDQSREASSIVENVENYIGVKSFTVHSKIDDWHAPIAERIHPPLEHWLMAFANSEFVVTDSFHGCVFAIIFNRDFVVIGNKHRGMARIESLLEQFGLSYRLVDITLINDFHLCQLRPIDWVKVNNKHKELQKRGIDFLKYNLNN